MTEKAQEACAEYGGKLGGLDPICVYCGWSWREHECRDCGYTPKEGQIGRNWLYNEEEKK